MINRFDMTYKQALLFLDSRISVGWKLGLDSMRRMLAELDNPHQKTKFVHIAGTNGKGSVAAMLESVFRTAGYKTGLFTSPHLIDVRERVRVNGAMIERKAFATLVEQLRPIIERYNATYFETLTILAFLYFANVKTDIVFLEVGLGGRLDATNVVEPELSIITSISYDHTEHLGDTLAEIAGEKAGIIKRKRPCLIGNMPEDVGTVIGDYARQKNAPLYDIQDLCEYTIENETLGATYFSLKSIFEKSGRYKIAMNGKFQVGNACLAISACYLLRPSRWDMQRDHILNGLEQTRWPGRFQVVQKEPLVIFDVAHNVASIEQLVRLLRQFCSDKKIYFIFGVLKDKDVGQITRNVAEIAHAVQPVELDFYRAFPACELHSIFQHFQIKLFPPTTVSEAIENMRSQLDENSVLCVTGSHYLVGEALSLTKGLTK